MVTPRKFDTAEAHLSNTGLLWHHRSEILHLHLENRNIPAIIISPNDQAKFRHFAKPTYKPLFDLRMSDTGWEADSHATRLVEPYLSDDCRAFDGDECTLEEADQPWPSIYSEGQHTPAGRCHHEYGDLGIHGR